MVDTTSLCPMETRKKLESKVYWIVDYSKKKIASKNKNTILKQYGGDISVFIDKKTGEILTTCVEE